MFDFKLRDVKGLAKNKLNISLLISKSKQGLSLSILLAVSDVAHLEVLGPCLAELTHHVLEMLAHFISEFRVNIAAVNGVAGRRAECKQLHIELLEEG